MEFAIVFLIILVAVPILIIAAIYRAIQSQAEGKSLFTGAIPEDRAQFLKEIFGLTVDECRLLHFDGYSFHLRAKRPYKEFESVSLIEAKDVRVTNSRLPHYTTWQHTRVDGGPDRRYSSNPQIFISRRFRVRFNGTSQDTLVGYTRPYGDVSKALEKINALLSCATAVDLEARFADYAHAFNRAQNFQGMLDRAQTERLKLESVVSAFRRLKAGGTPDDPSVSDKHTGAVSELNRLNLEVQQLQRELASETGRMAQIVRTVHSEIDRFRDLQKVKRYQPPSTAQKQFEQARDEAQHRQERQKPSFRDYYKILQIDPSAEPEVITGAYRRLAAKYHPDVYKGQDASQRMQMINEAYTVLNDPVKRKKYDQVWARKMIR